MHFQKLLFQAHRHALPGPDDITREVLPNGITLLTRSNFNSPTLSIKGYLPSGSLFDPDEKLGLGYMTANALMTGTRKHDFQSMYNEIESVGASLGFSAGTLTTSFSAHCLTEDLDLILGLIAESLRTPTFPLKEFNRQKTQLLTALAIREQDTSAMAALLFDQLIFVGHPYQRPDEGFPATVQAIQREDLENFHRSTYGPRGMVLAIVGDVPGQQAVQAVKNSLGDWSNPQQAERPEVPIAYPLQKTQKKSVSIPGKAQADLVIGCLAPPRHSPDYHTLRVANNILGEFGMMGRLGQNIREKAGLAYYVYSSLSTGIGPGAWEMIAGINPKYIGQTIKLIIEELSRFVSETVSKEELADTKSYFLGRMPLLMESNSGVAISLMNLEHFGLGLDYFYNYPKLIQNITPKAVLQATQKYLDPERLAIAVAGP